MNTNLAYTLPTTAPAESPTRHIEVVPTRQQRRARPRMLYAAVTIGGVFAILIAQLLISIVLSDGAYQISALQSEQKELSRSAGTLTEELDLLASPQHLAASAEALGMVSNSNPAFLRLTDGAVLGAPATADATAGSVIGPGGSLLVPNSLLDGVPLAGASTPDQVAPPAAPPEGGTWTSSAAPTAQGPAQAGAPAGSETGGSVASNSGTLPAPTTR
ncbi:hypothetical protein [Diaminobutyricimonas sp. TR449]|uniref:hypothetical protein n=1 Tax=Diaminobutyricimonas sp. TR449 TaxID=2708076 RepID=UPI00141F3562|nr:hypothetical protein [Diaminobutyricimonas sp. TR449]